MYHLYEREKNGYNFRDFEIVMLSNYGWIKETAGLFIFEPFKVHVKNSAESIL